MFVAGMACSYLANFTAFGVWDQTSQNSQLIYANIALISGKQDPQFVPAFRHRPTSVVVFRPCVWMAVFIVVAPTLKQAQTMSPVSATPCGARPDSNALRSAELISVWANKLANQFRGGNL